MSKGFTLMELMIAAAILILALVGLLGVFIGSFGLVESAENLTIAVNHAQSVVEQMRDYNIPALVTSQNWTTWAQADYPSGGGCNTLQSESIQATYPSGTSADPLEIMITVNWSEAGRQRSVELTTLLAER